MTSLLAAAPPESLGLSPERLARLDAALEAEIERQKLPGAVAMIARRGKVAHFKAYGRLDPRQDVPMPKDAIFRIYSMTKPVVSVAVMMLVEEGRLLLSQPVSMYLPEFASPQVLVENEGQLETAPAGRAITVHDLLRHTAGFTYQFMGATPLHQRYAAAGLFGRGKTNADFTQALAALPLLRQPGTAWAYSHATDVLGRLVEVVTGRSLGEHLREAIFEPLGMTETAFHVDGSNHHRIAEPFAKDPDSGAPVSVFDVRSPSAQEMGRGPRVHGGRLRAVHGDDAVGRPARWRAPAGPEDGAPDDVRPPGGAARERRPAARGPWLRPRFRRAPAGRRGGGSGLGRPVLLGGPRGHLVLHRPEGAAARAADDPAAGSP